MERESQREAQAVASVPSDARSRAKQVGVCRRTPNPLSRQMQASPIFWT